MATKIAHFRVGNGDMTLVTTNSGHTLLIDCNIRADACDADCDTPDVLEQLKKRLPLDYFGRRYVHAMLLGHPDQDHCRGLAEHFHMGPLADCPKDTCNILVREMWSSPIVFRRAERKPGGHKLCDDAKAWAAEARRRVNQFRRLGYCPDGERIRILGEDENGKTDDLSAILTKVDGLIRTINGEPVPDFSAQLLAPLPKGDDEEEKVLSKNDSSVIMRFDFGAVFNPTAVRFLTGGDAGVAIWERLRGRHAADLSLLEYDLLLSPHHCSWRSMSGESWSDSRGTAEPSASALTALGQARSGARIIASSKPIENDYDDPPCWGAKREYEAIATRVKGEFVCLADAGPEPLEFKVEAGGLKLLAAGGVAAPVLVGGGGVGAEPIGHGG